MLHGRHGALVRSSIRLWVSRDSVVGVTGCVGAVGRTSPTARRSADARLSSLGRRSPHIKVCVERHLGVRGPDFTHDRAAAGTRVVTGSTLIAPRRALWKTGGMYDLLVIVWWSSTGLGALALVVAALRPRARVRALATAGAAFLIAGVLAILSIGLLFLIVAALCFLAATRAAADADP
jgi:hypothetical protein